MEYLKDYDFALSCEKFKNDFNFTFEETLDTVIDSLEENKSKIISSDRNTPTNIADKKG